MAVGSFEGFQSKNNGDRSSQNGRIERGQTQMHSMRNVSFKLSAGCCISGNVGSQIGSQLARGVATERTSHCVSMAGNFMRRVEEFQY